MNNSEQKADLLPSASLEQNGLLGEGRLDAALALLAEYEEWEAMLIADNAMWWPYVPKDRISGKSYDKMMELKAKRNELLGR